MPMTSTNSATKPTINSAKSHTASWWSENRIKPPTWRPALSKAWRKKCSTMKMETSCMVSRQCSTNGLRVRISKDTTIVAPFWWNWSQAGTSWDSRWRHCVCNTERTSTSSLPLMWRFSTPRWTRSSNSNSWPRSSHLRRDYRNVTSVISTLLRRGRGIFAMMTSKVSDMGIWRFRLQKLLSIGYSWRSIPKDSSFRGIGSSPKKIRISSLSCSWKGKGTPLSSRWKMASRMKVSDHGRQRAFRLPDSGGNDKFEHSPYIFTIFHICFLCIISYLKLLFKTHF